MIAQAFINAADALALFAEQRRHVADLLLKGGKSWPAYQLLARRRVEAVDALGALFDATHDVHIAPRMSRIIAERDSGAEMETWAAEYRQRGRELADADPVPAEAAQ